MDAIIESLKARKARNSAMLNPGRKAGSAGGSLLTSPSLHPQLVFRQMKASFSVKQPSMTALKAGSMAAFSKKAESKYSGGQNLLHIRPTSAGSTPAVQRAPASMPLPSVGGSAPAAAGETPSSVSPVSPVSTLAYPPKSERRPVVFDKTDGPSDFEKRLMAAKKQKQAQEAKKQGPDRRRVRTERIEISASDSKEINREFSDQWTEPTARPAAARKGSVSSGDPGGNTVRREPLFTNKSGTASDTSGSGGEDPGADTIQREPGDPEPLKPGPADRSGNTVRREINTSETGSSTAAVRNEHGTGSRSELPVREAADSGMSVMREMSGPQDLSEIPEAKESAPSVKDDGQTVRRETSAPEVKGPAAAVRKSAQTVQREMKIPVAGPVSTAAEDHTQSVQREMDIPQAEPAPAIKEDAQTVQREMSIPEAKPVAPSAKEDAQTVQREMTNIPEAKPMAPAAKEDTQTVQREMSIPEAKPMVPAAKEYTQTVQREMKGPEANSVSSAAAEDVQTVQRELNIPEDKMAVPAAKEEKQIVQRDMKAPESKPVSSAVKENTQTVQREMNIPAARPVSSAVKEVRPAVQREMNIPDAETVSTAAEENTRTIQREMNISAAKPVLSATKENTQTVQREMKVPEAKPVSSAAEENVHTVQREMKIPEARSVSSAAEKNVQTIQREMKVPEAKPASHAPAENTQTVQREMKAPEAKPVSSAVEENTQTVQREMKVPEAKPVSSAVEENTRTVQREMKVPEARPVSSAVEENTQTVQREMKVPEASPVSSAAKESVQTVQREIDIPEARPVSSAAEENMQTVQRETDAASFLSGSKADTVQRVPDLHAAPAGQVPDRNVQSGKKVPVAKPFGSSGPQKSEGTVRREMKVPEAHPVRNSGARSAGPGSVPAGGRQINMPLPHEHDADTVQRETASGSSGDLSELLKGLPTHYEMPQEQIEAIRFGKQYTPSGSSGSAPENAVQREMLPPKKTEKLSAAGRPRKSSVSREYDPEQSSPFSGQWDLPSGSFGQKNSAGNQGSPFRSSESSGNNSDSVVQREYLESEKTESRIETEPAAPQSAAKDESPAENELNKRLEELLPEVTAKQLDQLADQLLPRIKRIMRNEMERSLFR